MSRNYASQAGGYWPSGDYTHGQSLRNYDYDYDYNTRAQRYASRGDSNYDYDYDYNRGVGGRDYAVTSSGRGGTYDQRGGAGGSSAWDYAGGDYDQRGSGRSDYRSARGQQYHDVYGSNYASSLRSPDYASDYAGGGTGAYRYSYNDATHGQGGYYA